MTKIKELKSKIEHVPPSAINDLGIYLDFLMQLTKPDNDVRLKQKWAGGLKNLRKTYTSIELQKKLWNGEKYKFSR